jgi:hypothetical protein
MDEKIPFRRRGSEAEPIADEMRFNGLLQELLSAPATAMSAEEGFALIQATLDRLIETISGPHYRAAPTNIEIEAGETSTDPKDKVTLGTVESRKKYPRRGRVPSPGPEQQLVKTVLIRIKVVLSELGREYLSNGEWSSVSRKFRNPAPESDLQAIEDVLGPNTEMAPEASKDAQGTPGRLTDLEHRDRLLGRQLAQWQLTKPRSDLSGTQSNAWHGLTLREISRSRKRQIQRKKNTRK